MAEPVLAPLAGHGDVRVALGVSQGQSYDDVTMLPSTMQVRMDTTLAKVSRRFRKEAQRIFTPGVYTHRLRIEGGAIRLAEVPSSVNAIGIEGLTILPDGAVETPDDTTNLDWPIPQEVDSPAPTWQVVRNWILFQDWDFWRLSGRLADVNYSWDTPVPTDVVAAVADITARNLVVDPMGAERQSKLLMSRHFRQEMADWVMSGDTGFTQDDIDQARSYRYPAPPRIITHYSSQDITPSQAFLSDSSW